MRVLFRIGFLGTEDQPWLQQGAEKITWVSMVWGRGMKHTAKGDLNPNVTFDLFAPWLGSPLAEMFYCLLQKDLSNKLAMGSGYQSGVQEAVESDKEILQALEK